MRRRAVLVFLGISACGRGGTIDMTRPADRAFVPSGAPIPLAATIPGASRLIVQVDGGAPIEADTTTGDFAALLPPLARGRHVLTATAPEIAGLGLSRELFVDRMPDEHIDGYGFEGADWVVTLSDARPTDDGLFAGALTLASVSTSAVGAVSRRLSGNAVTAEVSPGPAAHVSWIESWSHGRGQLHVDTALGDPARALTFGGVRSSAFAPDGYSLLAVDDGAFILETPFVEPTRINAVADGAVYLGPAEDVLTWRLEADGAHAAVSSAPGYVPVAIGPPVTPHFVANPTRREIGMTRAEGDALGALLLYEVDTEGNLLLYGAVSAFGFSDDGQWLLALTSADGTGAGNVSLLRRQPPSGAFTIPGSFTAASFDAALDAVFALEKDGTFSRIDLAAGTAAPIASDVTKFATLTDGALVWQDTSGGMWVRRTDAVVEKVGVLNPLRLEVAFSRDGRMLAFTAEGGAVRRVDLTTGRTDDFGVDAHRPAFLQDGALAWAERRADAQPTGLANDDLWIFPAWPESFLGARQVAARVDSAGPFDVSPDGTVLAVLAGLPRVGEPWAAHALCIDEHLRCEDLGLADSSRREIHYRADSRILWFGENRVLYLAPCRPQ